MLNTQCWQVGLVDGLSERVGVVISGLALQVDLFASSIRGGPPQRVRGGVESGRSDQHDQDASAHAVRPPMVFGSAERPVACLEDMIAADLDEFAMQDEDTAGLDAGLDTEVGDGVVANDQSLDIGHADGAVAEA